MAGLTDRRVVARVHRELAGHVRPASQPRRRPPPDGQVDCPKTPSNEAPGALATIYWISLPAAAPAALAAAAAASSRGTLCAIGACTGRSTRRGRCGVKGNGRPAAARRGRCGVLKGDALRHRSLHRKEHPPRPLRRQGERAARRGPPRPLRRPQGGRSAPSELAPEGAPAAAAAASRGTGGPPRPAAAAAASSRGTLCAIGACTGRSTRRGRCGVKGNGRPAAARRGRHRPSRSLAYPSSSLPHPPPSHRPRRSRAAWCWEPYLTISGKSGANCLAVAG